MRDFISFFVNGQKQEVREGDVFLTLSDYLRLRLGLYGTKIVCSEGDCGSCTVLCGFPVFERFDDTQTADNLTGDAAPSVVGFEYRAIDSCIRFVFQLDGVHIVTVEGLVSDGEKLNGVQQAMVDCHGSQCGFCTPGFVMAMTGILQEKPSPTVAEIRHGLTGNLCRCTGYVPIIDAACHSDVTRDTDMRSRFPVAELLSEMTSHRERASIRICHNATQSADVRQVHCPTRLNEAVQILAENPQSRVVAGATDLGVQSNKGKLADTTFIELGRIPELTKVSIYSDKIIAGAMATWSQLESVFEQHIPQFSKIISVFGSPQIRHVGTIGGNLINASPIADSIPFLYICDALLTLTSVSGERQVNINHFYQGYKKLDLNPTELLTRIEIPLPKSRDELRLYRISRRRDMDISTFTAAIHIETGEGSIQSAKIAYGAVGPTVVRMKNTEDSLIDKPFARETFEHAGKVAIDEIKPLTDVRGSLDYRNQLARNVLLKYYFESPNRAISV